MTEETTKTIETTGKIRTRLFGIPYLSSPYGLFVLSFLFGLSLTLAARQLPPARYLANTGNAISEKRYIGLINEPLNSIYTADILVVTNDHKEAIGG